MHPREYRQQARDLYRNEGQSFTEIAETLGADMRTIRRWIDPVRYDLTPEQKRRQSERLKARRAAQIATRLPDPVPGALWLLGKGGQVLGAAIVDVEDWERFKGIRFFRNGMGYAVCRFDGRQVYLHRLIVGLERGDRRQVDHINRNQMDNRRVNLRVCTAKENSANRGGIFSKEMQAA